MPKKSNKKKSTATKTKSQRRKDQSERMKAYHAKRKQAKEQNATVEVAKAVKATADATKTLAENITPKKTTARQPRTTTARNKAVRVVLHNFMNKDKPIQKASTLPFIQRYLEGLNNLLTADEKKKPAFEIFSDNGLSFVRLTPRMTISHMITWIENYRKNMKNAKAASKGRTKTTGTKRVSKTGKPLGRPKGSHNKAGHKAGRPKGSGKKK